MRLSVIIPGYNNPDAWWRRCVLSVLAAIGDDDEVLCVDDASSAPPSCLWDLAAEDKRVRVIRRDVNGGLAAARNMAMDAARGRYITFVDSDDEIVEGVYESAVVGMEKYHAAVCVFGVRTIWTSEHVEKTDIPAERCYGALSAKDVEELTRLRLFNYAWNKIYDLQVIRGSLREWDFRFDVFGMPCEDAIFNLNVALLGLTWCSISEVGYVYYRTGSTLLSRYRPTNYEGLKRGSDMWIRYKSLVPDARKILQDFGEIRLPELKWLEWANFWLPGSPLGLRQRWRWLSDNADILRTESRGIIGSAIRHSVGIAFVYTAIYSCLRRYFYFTPIRRWHICKNFRNAVRMR